MLIALVENWRNAPDLTLRLGPNDRHLSAPFAPHFLKDGPWLNWLSEVFLTEGNLSSLSLAHYNKERG
jgi:hypothetical protein